jgi:hypothetical protein
MDETEVWLGRREGNLRRGLAGRNRVCGEMSTLLFLVAAVDCDYHSRSSPGLM